ncbi:lactate utilization protein C, partial [Streptomyces sp. T-3]|nr:lactate utilization protein C [Streptomyces sp. T-3]
MSSRDLILGRVRRALLDVPRDEVAYETYERAVRRDYLRVHGSLTTAQTVDLLAENLADYRAVVHRAEASGLPALLARLLGARGEQGARRVLVPPGLPAHWLDAA